MAASLLHRQVDAGHRGDPARARPHPVRSGKPRPQSTASGLTDRSVMTLGHAALRATVTWIVIVP